jgi:hypothetical protein
MRPPRSRRARAAVAVSSTAIATLCCCAFIGLSLAPHASAVIITFTGDVTVDFDPSTNPSVFVVTDSKPPITYTMSNGTVVRSGWDIVDIRYAYDLDSDTAFFGAAPRMR